MKVGRRAILKRSFLGLAGLGLAGGAAYWKRRTFKPQSDPNNSQPPQAGPGSPPDAPIYPANQGQDNLPRQFSGDKPHRAHEILWNKEKFLSEHGGIPPASESASVVIIGGGVAGLVSTYKLRDVSPILLEQADNFGGNSKAEIWGDTAYSIGAAYIAKPDPGGRVESMLTELGLIESLKNLPSQDQHAFVDNHLYSSFWDGDTDFKHRHHFQAIHKRILELDDDELPSVPLSPNLSKPELTIAHKLDRLSFKDWLTNEFEFLPPHAEDFFQQYSFSTFAASWTEISALHALNFLSSDLKSAYVAVGGNAQIVQKIYDTLKNQTPKGHIRSGTFVIDIQNNSGGVQVCYQSTDGVLKTIQAQAAIVCAPKFVAKKLISGLPARQQAAIQQIKYRAYVVANIIFDGPIHSPCFDAFYFNPKGTNSSTQVLTDFVYSGWANQDQSDHGVLTLYRPYAYEGAREGLYQENAHEKTLVEFQSHVPSLLKDLGLEKHKVLDIRLTRWGHAIPVSACGLIADGKLKLASAPHGKIYFAQQDNWASPCFEAAVLAAFEATSNVRGLLKPLNS